MIGHTISHYRVIERIGAGGMGVVYRAHDEQLDRDVALKILPTGILADDDARKRFRQEALALAKLNHPNIATIHELGSAEGVDFLVMELVPGVALSERLGAGPLDESEIRRLGAQLAEGLAAAHAQGVIHRDLKPANLQITPEGRLKILDFGLAKLLRPATESDKTLSFEDTHAVTGTHALTGTLPYMSPEQLRGDQADGRSDVYGAGTVLYEMATGQRAFPEAQTARLIDSILHEAPKPPASLYSRVSPALEEIILRSLEKEPARRYQSAGELLVALDGLKHETASPGVRGRKTAGVVAAAIVLVLGIVLGLNIGNLRGRFLKSLSSPKDASHASGPTTAPRRSIAVLGFKNASGRSESAWLSTGLSEMLTTELGTGEKVRTIPEENVVRAKMDLSLSDADSLSKDTLERLRRNLGTDYVVLGSFVDLGTESGGQVRLDLRLQDAHTGELISVASETGTERELFDLVSKAGSELRNHLGLGEMSATESKALRATLSLNPEAARFYAQGLAKLRVSDALAAKDALEKAAQADPKFPLAHSMLAETWWNLGYENKAREESKTAVDLGTNLSREEQLSIEGRFEEFSRNLGQAGETYKALVHFFPDNVEYALRLAAVQTSSGLGKDALSTVAAIRTANSQATDDPRLDLAEANAWDRTGEYQKFYDAAQRGAAKARVMGARLLVAQALVMEGNALSNLGRATEAQAAVTQGLSLFQAAGMQDGVARAYNNLGIIQMGHGDYAAAQKSYQETIRIDKEIGFLRGIRQADNNLGIIYLEQGNLSSAQDVLQKAFSVARETGDKTGEYNALGNLAKVFTLLGDIPASKRAFEQLLAAAQELHNKSHIARAYDGLGSTYESAGDLNSARKNYELAVNLSKELGMKPLIAEDEVSLAGILTEQGDPASAEKLCREAREEFRKEQDVDDEIYAEACLVDTFLAQNKTVQAQSEIASSKDLPQKSQHIEFRLDWDIARARAATAAGDTASAKSILQTAILDAKAKNYRGLEFEGRLALGETEMKSGEVVEGRTLLTSLEKEARAKGFLGIARKAHAASDRRGADAKKRGANAS
jgi:serine/threonine protein kinase/tetratricopeptide (TPR) repeat protein